MTRDVNTRDLTMAQVRQLQAEARAAGDYMMEAICIVALEGAFDGDDYAAIASDLSPAEYRRLSGMDRYAAYAAICRAINAARAAETMD